MKAEALPSVEPRPFYPAVPPPLRRRYVPALPTLDPARLALRRREALHFPFDDERTRYVYFCRNAIFHAMRRLLAGPLAGRPGVLVPAYHHGVEVEALEAAGLELQFFDVGRRFDADLDDAAVRGTSRTGMLYLIHYAGFPQDVERARRLCAERGWLLVEDCALSLLSAHGDRALGSRGDLAFFCLYKALPLPHGGAMICNRPGLLDGDASFADQPPPLSSTASHLIGSLLGSLERRAGRPGALIRETMRRTARPMLHAAKVERVAIGSDHFDPRAADLGMSELVRWLVERIDLDEVVSRRRRNYQGLRARLVDLAPPLIWPLADGVCPLFYPCRPLADRRRPRPGLTKAKLVERLQARGVEAIDFWSAGHPGAAGRFPEVERLRAEVLELPIHQDLEAADLDYVAQSVREVLS